VDDQENTYRIWRLNVCRFTVAEWLTHLAATLEVIGSRPSLAYITEIYVLELIQSPAPAPAPAQRDLKWSV